MYTMLYILYLSLAHFLHGLSSSSVITDTSSQPCTPGILGWFPQEFYTPISSFLNRQQVTKDTPSPTPSEVPSQPPSPPSSPAEPLPLAPTVEEQQHNLLQAIKKDDNIPSDIPIKSSLGKSQLMCPRTHCLSHPAAPLLQQYSTTGCPVDCGDNWSLQHILLLLKRGPHISGKHPAAINFLCKETMEKVEQGYARVVRWGDIKQNHPPQLKISPVAMIPHKSKAYRCILDLSFGLRHKGTTMASVNSSTIKKAKPQSMAQLGKCIRRLVATMAKHHKRHKPFLFAKLDIKDGFWRMAVGNDEAWNFCYVLPSITPVTSVDHIELVVPNSLQMGWCESPPFFCSGTETVWDVIAKLHSSTHPLQQHPFEHIMMKEFVKFGPTTARNRALHHPDSDITEIEVYIDDFCVMTNVLDDAHLRRLSRCMIHGIHSVFPPPNITNHCGADPISEKKLAEGEGTWAFKKEILGWEFDGLNATITLPSKKCAKITSQIKHLTKQKTVTLKDFQKIAGKLQHALFGLPGGPGLFSQLDHVMQQHNDNITITPELRECLWDWRYLITHLAAHPTHVSQLVQELPHCIGYSNACRLGAGGVLCSGQHQLFPVVWQVR